MGEVNDLNTLELIEAVKVWTGWGKDAWPGRHDDLLVARFGEATASNALLILESLKADFYSSDASLVAADLPEMTAIASAQFEKKHPGISKEIVKAFAWCFTFSHR